MRATGDGQACRSGRARALRRVQRVGVDPGRHPALPAFGGIAGVALAVGGDAFVHRAWRLGDDDADFAFGRSGLFRLGRRSGMRRGWRVLRPLHRDHLLALIGRAGRIAQRDGALAADAAVQHHVSFCRSRLRCRKHRQGQQAQQDGDEGGRARHGAILRAPGLAGKRRGAGGVQARNTSPVRPSRIFVGWDRPPVSPSASTPSSSGSSAGSSSPRE